MLVWIVEYLKEYDSSFSILSCLTFRTIASLLTAFFISLWIGPYIIFYLQNIAFNQVIRFFGPKSHINSKCNTPTMGGIIIIIAIVVAVLLWTHLSNLYIYFALITLISYGIIGFIDDYRKVACQDTDGLLACWKYLWMSIIALVISFTLYFLGRNTSATKLVVPFFKDIIPQLSVYYILLTYLVIVGTGNAINLTDGLDGLAIMPTIFVSGGFAYIAWLTGNINYANYLHIPYLYYANELVIICTSIVGAGLGFLWFNTYPAQVFMGDVGSLALGGTIGTIAVLLRQEFLLLIMGGLFVIETLSVIIQVICFRLFKQRIFLMTPIHHHYELQGYPEPRVVIRFWIISFIFMLIGLIILRVRGLW